MHILHVTLGFLPAEAWGGPAHFVYQYGKELIHRGHHVTVYCTNLLDKKNKIRPQTFEQIIDSIRVVYFNAWNLSWWPGTLGPIWLPNINSYLDCEKHTFDVIHLNGYRSPMNIQVVNALKANSIPIILQPHGTMQLIVNSILWKKLYDKFLGSKELKRVNVFVALQEHEKKQIISFGIPEEKTKIIPIGLDTSRKSEFPSRHYFRNKFNIPLEKPMILFLGRINRKKGTDMLMQAFTKIQALDAVLVIAGPDDGQLAEIQNLVEKYNLNSRVYFTGLISGPLLWGAYQDADLFVLPCRTDTFPAVIMEACLAETPMVITDGCEIANLVKGRVAEVTPFDSNEFAHAIDRLLSDKDLYQTYKKNCPRMMQDTFSIQASVDKLEALYQRVIAEKAKS
jgi:glycosyltransferase involved in cell wall biosynthesis